MAGLVVGLRTALVAAPLLLTSVMLAGCSGDDATTSPAAVSTPSASTAETSAPPTLRAAAPALQDLTITACPAGTGRLEATGDLRNYGTTSADYVVTVTWLDANGSILDSAFTVVENLATRQQKSWKLAATLDESAASCTTRVSRGRL